MAYTRKHSNCTRAQTPQTMRGAGYSARALLREASIRSLVIGRAVLHIMASCRMRATPSRAECHEQGAIHMAEGTPKPPVKWA